MSQDALGQLKHLKTARARWPFPDVWCGVVHIVDGRQFRLDWFQGCLPCQRSQVLKGSMLPLATGARSKFGTRSRILREIGTASLLLSSSVTGAQQLVWVRLVCILISVRGTPLTLSLVYTLYPLFSLFTLIYHLFILYTLFEPILGSIILDYLFW